MNSVQLAKKLGAKHIGPNVNIKSIGDILKTPPKTPKPHLHAIIE